MTVYYSPNYFGGQLNAFNTGVYADYLKGISHEVRVGELTGWRGWNVVIMNGELRLSSLSMSTVWENGLCGPTDGLKNSSNTHSDILSGYYAYKSKKDAIDGIGSCSHIIGEVELYGNVLELTDGYHAEYCKIKSLEETALLSLIKPPPRQRGFKEWLDFRNILKSTRRDRILEELRSYYLEK